MGKELREAFSPEMLKKSAKMNRMMNRPAKGNMSSKASLYIVRYVIGKMYRSVPKVKGTRFTKVNLGKTPAILAEYGESNKSRDIIVYIHGGAFMSGSAASSRGYISCLAEYSGCRVYSLDYSLSPEVKYPVAFNECIDAANELIKNNPDSKITLVGDSAGGNLSLAVALKLKETGKISCVIVHSPVTDFSDTLDRAKYKKDGIVVGNGLKSTFKILYFPDHDEKDPFISPFFGDYTGFPPTFITCDVNESLYADAQDIYEKCEASGTRVQMVALKGAFHAFAVMGYGTPETRKIVEDCIDFMRTVTAG